MTGIKDALKTAVDSIVGSVGPVGDKAENTSSTLADRLGDKVFGSTAESEVSNAAVIAPDASTIPVTQGRRSRAPDGKDPFRSEAPAPADES
ncbi:hypothetical protein BJY52DRAFT_1213342 [Lactarius psammicola]|nr:hypothetical protein BJY52DRAFT_1213342 [Lactarius psammicola]